jgi:hypothetical protein
MEWLLWGREWERVGDAVVVAGLAVVALGAGVRAAARRPPPPSAEEVRAWRRTTGDRLGR